MLWGYVDSRETLPTSPRLLLPTVCTVSCSRGSLESAGQQLLPVSVNARLEWRDVPDDPCTAHTRWFCEFAGFVTHSRTVNQSDERLGLCNSISNFLKLCFRCSRWCCCRHSLIVDLFLNSSSWQTFQNHSSIFYAAGGLKHCSCQCYSLPSSDSLIAEIGGKRNWLLLHLCTSITCPLGWSSVSQHTSTHLPHSSREHSRKCHHFSCSVNCSKMANFLSRLCVFTFLSSPVVVSCARCHQSLTLQRGDAEVQ